MENDLLPIQLEPQSNSIIKVLGVGGGGCNAANYLYSQGVQDVTFLACNTDHQALQKSPIPNKLQLGPGLGAGGKPECAAEFAEQSRDKIREALSDGTEMVFITAGMGGGTGTGASPIVAEVAQEMGILTVAIVTIPFAFEGKRIIRKALRGVARLAEHVDAILVINNEKLKVIYPDFDLPNAFDKSDQVVSNAAKAIAEIITVPGYINTDFQDVFNTLKDGGVAIMNVGKSSDPDERITKAINEALNSPLVNTTDVRGASRILLTFYCSKENAIRMRELDQINRFIDEVGDEVEVKWGASYDETLGEEVRVTVIATGYSVSDIPGIDDCDEEKPIVVNVTPKPTIGQTMEKYYGAADAPKVEINIAEPTDGEDEPTIEPDEEVTAEPIDLDAEEPTTEEPIEEEPAEEEPVAEPTPHTFTTGNNANVLTFDLDDDMEAEIDSTPAWMRRNR